MITVATDNLQRIDRTTVTIRVQGRAVTAAALGVGILRIRIYNGFSDVAPGWRVRTTRLEVAGIASEVFRVLLSACGLSMNVLER